jgi:MFS superfamily sulfate permease-like transporter
MCPAGWGAQGASLAELRTDGWVEPVPEAFGVLQPWELFGATVHWGAILKVLPTWATMVMVVAFGSCLDVAAISLQLGQRLDYDHELRTVSGLSLVECQRLAIIFASHA